MPSPGVPINTQVLVPLGPQETFGRMQLAVSGVGGGYFDGVSVVSDGARFITVERKYVPTWAVVVAIIGLLCALLGLLALLFRDTERCQIQIRPQGARTLVQVNGVLPPALHYGVTATLTALEQGT
jgi:hypothetical protein